MRQRAHLVGLLLAMVLASASAMCLAGEPQDNGYADMTDTLVIDEALSATLDSLASADMAALTDTAKPSLIQPADTAEGDTLMPFKKTRHKKEKRDWSSWRPKPQRAMWLAIVLPGAGQIYNRKYWKLPIVYGGFLGCIYAMRWNNMMYHDYSQAYMDIMDDNPETESYNQFLHLGATITDSNKSTYQNIFKKRKDYYRKYRDLSVFALIGVYALSIIDAYVDASLSEFDISKDLSLKVEPTVIRNKTTDNPIKSSSLGLQCSLNF